MELAKIRTFAGCALFAIVAGLGLLGCAGDQVPNQRVYDRYESLMRERRARPQPAQPVAEPTRASDVEKISASAASNRETTPPKAKKKNHAVRSASPASKPAPKPAPVAVEPVLEPVSVPEPVPEVVSEPESVSAPELISAPEPTPVAESVPVVEPVSAVEPAPVEIVMPPAGAATPAPVAEPAPLPVPAAVPEAVPAPVSALPPPVVDSPASVLVQDVTQAFDGENSAYVLKAGDGVQISLRGIPQPEQIECLVDEYGMISLPLINEVKAVGLSAAELAKNIRQIYLDQGLYRNITINVMIPTRYYFTQGEFRSPGRYQMIAAVRLSQAIAGAAGFTDFASGQVLVRRNGIIFKTIKNARRLDRTPEDDILLEPDDIIEAVRSWW